MTGNLGVVLVGSAVAADVVGGESDVETTPVAVAVVVGGADVESGSPDATTGTRGTRGTRGTGSGPGAGSEAVGVADGEFVAVVDEVSVVEAVAEPVVEADGEFVAVDDGLGELVVLDDGEFVVDNVLVELVVVGDAKLVVVDDVELVVVDDVELVVVGDVELIVVGDVELVVADSVELVVVNVVELVAAVDESVDVVDVVDVQSVAMDGGESVPVADEFASGEQIVLVAKGSEGPSVTVAEVNVTVPKICRSKIGGKTCLEREPYDSSGVSEVLLILCC